MRDEYAVDDLLRPLVPRVLGALVRRHGDFDACEEAVQDALLDATRAWPQGGVPDDPTAWLVRVANRRLTDRWRSEHARRAREERAFVETPVDTWLAPPADADQRQADGDDTLTLSILCCHPALSPASQVALTLRAVGGLTTAQIARAYLVPESTMAQRISRAKRTIQDAGARFVLPPEPELSRRLGSVLHALYLIFNEGYTTTGGDSLHDPRLTAEAIRVTRAVRQARPDDREVAGLLALMLLTESRRSARTTRDGAMVPLAEQDRDRWDHSLIAEGVALVTQTLSGAEPGPYQLQAAIAAVHAEAASTDDTDWQEILVLYKVLDHVSPNPVARLNQAVASATVHGPQAGLDELARLEHDPLLAGNPRLDAVRGHLLEQTGDLAGAREAFLSAARGTLSLPEQRYLQAQAARLGNRTGSGPRPA